MKIENIERVKAVANEIQSIQEFLEQTENLTSKKMTSCKLVVTKFEQGTKYYHVTLDKLLYPSIREILYSRLDRLSDELKDL
jgi:hypothetical protein